MVVQHNMTAANANRMLGNVVTQQTKSTEKLSSGYRINRAGDDAAGLAISEKMRGQIRGLDQASANSQDGISLIQTAEGALTETHSILQRMRELAVQAASDTNTDDDRTQIQNEINQLTSEVDRIATSTEFNTKKLLDGSKTGAVNQKDGSVKMDGSFGNSTVSTKITKDGTAKAGYTDVIAITVNKDFKEGQSTKAADKLSEDAMSDIYKMLSTTAAASVASDEFKLKTMTGTATNGTPTNNIATVANPANTSLDEKISTVLSQEKTELTNLKKMASTAEGAVAANEDTKSELLSKIEKFNVTIKNANTSTEDGKLGIYAEGVSTSDVDKALNEYIDLLVENGTATGSNATGNAANGSSDQLKAAEEKLKNLFYKGNDTVAGLSAAANTTGAHYNVASAGTGATPIQKSNTSAYALGTAGKSYSLTGTANPGIKSIADDVANDLITIAKSIAGTKIDLNNYNKDIEKQEKLVDTLSDKELVTSIYNYKKAEADESTVASNANATDSAKAEAKAKVAEEKAKVDALNKEDSVISVSDLFGNGASSDKFEVGAAVDKDNKLNITLKGKDGEDTVITINNADKLKAGDKLTITTSEMVESQQAKVGADAIHLQIGANAAQEMSLGINSMRATDLNIVQTKEGKEGAALDVTNQASASLAINAYDMAIQKVSTERAKMGATQNRLEHTISNLNTSAENLQTAESRIRDVDMASEMVSYSKNNIIQQAAQSMLAQANQSNQGVLSLLR